MPLKGELVLILGGLNSGVLLYLFLMQYVHLIVQGP